MSQCLAQNRFDRIFSKSVPPLPGTQAQPSVHSCDCPSPPTSTCHLWSSSPAPPDLRLQLPFLSPRPARVPLQVAKSCDPWPPHQRQRVSILHSRRTACDTGLILLRLCLCVWLSPLHGRRDKVLHLLHLRRLSLGVLNNGCKSAHVRDHHLTLSATWVAQVRS